MRKISLLITTILILSFVPLTSAQNQAANDLQQCTQRCLDAKNTQAENAVLECQTQCRLEMNQKNYLPPIAKPDLLPGPKFARNNKRSIHDINEFVNEKLIPKIARRFSTIVALASMLGIIAAGIMYFLALGDPEKGTKAKRTAFYSVIGLMIALLSFAIVQIIVSLPI